MPEYRMRRGDKAIIYNNTPDGIRIAEGVAELLKPLGITDDMAEYWLVRFEGDGTADRFPRWVLRNDKR
jgi:hypothetical protein